MYWKLVGVFLKQQFSLQRLFGSNVAQSWWKRLLFIGLLVYAMAVSLGGNLFLYVDLAIDLMAINQLELLLPILMANLSGIAIFLTLFQATGYLFAYKDFETLAPLPIPHWQVIAAKMTMMHLFVLLFSMLLNGPILGVYLYFAQASLATIILSIVLYILAPIPMMVLVSLISWIIHYVSSRFVNKNIMQIVLMMTFLLGYIGLSFGNFSDNILTFFEPMIDIINTYYQPALWFQQSIAEGNGLSIILFVVTHGFAYGVWIIIMTPLSRLSNLSQSTVRASSRTNVDKRYRQQSFFWTLFQKEWRYYFSIPIYFINTAFGLIMLLAGSIALWFFKEEVVLLFQMPDLSVEWLVLIFIGFSVSTVYTPAISLSLEGSNFSVLKSLPVQGLTVMMSKVLFNISLVTGPLILALFILSLTGIFQPLTIILFFINGISFTILSSLVNGLINLVFPKFQFQNEVEVVKQSMGAFLGVFSGFGIMVVLGGLLSIFQLNNFMTALIFLTIAQVLFLSFMLWIYDRFVSRWFSFID